MIGKLLAPFMPYIAGGLLALTGALAVALWWQSGRVETLTAENASLSRSVSALERSIELSRLSRDVAAARAKGAQAALAEKDAALDAIRTLNLGECADETLDPALRELLDDRGLRESD